MKKYQCIPLALALLAMLSCGNEKKKSTPHAQIQSKEQAAPQMVFTNGINEQNKGDKTGVVDLTFVLDFQEAKGKLVVYESEIKVKNPIDSAEIVDGIGRFPGLKCGQGVYWVSYQDSKNDCPFILNPTEKSVTLHIRNAALDKALYSTDSRENMAWSAYYMQSSEINKRILEKRRARTKSSQKEKYDELIAQDEAELNRLQATMIAQNMGTYFSKLLTWEQEPEREDKNHYWDNVDFSDYSLIRSRVIHERGQSFFRYFGGASEKGYMDCIDIVVERARVNPKALEPVLYSMLEGFSQTKYDGVCSYILDYYIFGDGCGAELSQVLQSRSQGIKNVQVGSVPPNIKLPMQKGGISDLYKLAAANKYTLVMFWSSWCEQCKAESPQVMEVYQQFHPKGFDILGVSIDKDKESWVSAVKQRGFVFPNVCGMKEWDSPVAKDYYVVKTPVMVVLDSNRKIVFRSTEGIHAVKSFLQSNLN